MSLKLKYCVLSDCTLLSAIELLPNVKIIQYHILTGNISRGDSCL